MESLRKVAVDIVEAVLTKGSYSNIILNTKLNNSRLEERDKALTTEIVYGTLKYKYTIDIILESFLTQKLNKMDSFIVNLLRISIYQINYLDKVPSFAVVNEAVEISKKYKNIGASKLVNGVLRNYLRNRDKNFAEGKDKIGALSYEYSFEPWMVKLFVTQYGEEKAETIMKGLNTTPALTVRVNSYKTGYEEAIENLKASGYEVEEGYVCPEAVRIVKGSSVEKNPLFRQGLITVQDESAMLVAPALNPEQNEIVMDLCSAPGGKTTHISELMNNSGQVYAFDIHSDKLKLIEDNAKRLHITNIQCYVMDAAVLNEKFIDFADKVLIDVPCSGLGIIRKKPEIKYTKNLKEMKALVDIQRNILKNASQYVKAGGTLLYSTCTLNKKENEETIKWFLDSFNNYSIEPLFYGNMDNIIYDKFGVTILPNEYMDGFFIAKLKRIR
jgi:16S rRNA (cytosine967-C5)-methyltransferase